jgi:cytochrome c
MAKCVSHRVIVLALFLQAWIAVPMVRAGDANAGADVFKSECSECHSVQAGHNKKGPSLFGIVGRKAASLPDYHYSDALLARTDWVWTAERLQSYLSQPAKQTNPGTKMKYSGLDDPKQRDDLISYLAAVH